MCEIFLQFLRKMCATDPLNLYDHMDPHIDTPTQTVKHKMASTTIAVVPIILCIASCLLSEERGSSLVATRREM